MGTAYSGVNYADTQANPQELIDEGQYEALEFHIMDSFVLTADLASGDTIMVGSLIPEGAIVLDCEVTTGALGGSCTIDVGWEASADGSEAKEYQGFFAALPVSSATVAKAHGSTYEGSFYMKQFAAAVQPFISEHAVSSGATGLKIQVDIKYTRAG